VPLRGVHPHRCEGGGLHAAGALTPADAVKRLLWQLEGQSLDAPGLETFC
jgi:hypothetical protein